MADFIVLLGPPGAGKGTQAKLVAEAIGLPHISSGAIFREHLKNKTGLGEIAALYINRGELVPDDVTIAMIKDRLSQPDCRLGALLDGFPRTPAQAEALDDMLADLDSKVGAVPYIEVGEAELIARLTGRWTCPVCGRVYHIRFNPPTAPGICDDDGAELCVREDDQVDTVTKRIRVYHEQTQPLIGYYQARGLLQSVDGEGSIESISAELLEVLKKEED